MADFWRSLRTSLLSTSTALMRRGAHAFAATAHSTQAQNTTTTLVPAMQIITKPGIPAAPASLECQEATKTSLTLSWSAPPHNGGLRIVAYEISLARARSPEQTAPSCTAATTATVSAEDELYEWLYFSKVCASRARPPHPTHPPLTDWLQLPPLVRCVRASGICGGGQPSRMLFATAMGVC